MSDIYVSDHALIRYLERVQGFDLERFRKEISEIVTGAARAGATQVSHSGFTYCIRDSSTVTTIIPGGSPHGARMKATQHNGRSIRMKKDR